MVLLEEMDVERPDFDWDNYFDQVGGAPADGALFQHVDVSVTSYAERRFAAGQIVEVEIADGVWNPAKILVVCGRSVFSEVINDEQPRKTFWFKLPSVRYCEKAEKIAESERAKIELNAQLVADKEKSSADSSNDSDEDSSRDSKKANKPKKKLIPAVRQLTQDDVQLAGQSAVTRVTLGQTLEVQDMNDPTIVRISKVKENRGGLLTIENSEGVERIFITSERLHSIGWCESKVQDCHLQMDQFARLLDMECNPVPSDVFESVLVKEHKFEVGMRLEVLDPQTKAVFYPGSVSKVINRHYFVVSVDRRLANATERLESSNVDHFDQIVCHRGSFGIFPVYWCQRHGIRLTPPEGLSDSDFSWQSYRTAIGIVKNDAPEQLFDLPRPVQRFQKGRRLEVIDPDNRDQLLPATIVRSFKHLVWIHFDQHSFATPPKIYGCRSLDLFPCGWAKEHGIPLVAPFRVPSVVSTANLGDLFSSEPTCLFLPNEKNFLPKKWLRDGLWLPTVHMNYCCFAGPFLDPEKLQKLPRHYGPGPLPLILHSLLGGLLWSAHRPKEFAEMVACSKDSYLPVIDVKARLKARRYRVRIESCQSAQQFPEWAAVFLRLIDACPNLFGVGKIESAEQCPWRCAKLAAIPFMTTANHANTANLFSKSQGKVPKRYRRGSLMGAGADLHPISAPRKRREKPTVPYEVRRPVTRGIKLPKFSSPSQMIKSPVNAAADRLKRRTVRTNGTSLTDKSKLPTGVAAPFLQPLVAKPLGVSKPTAAVAAHSMPRPNKPNDKFSIPPVQSNPQNWSCTYLSEWLKNTDSEMIIDRLIKEEVDGQAFMLLTLKDCMEYLGMKLGPALKVCGIIQELKLIYLTRYASSSQ